MSREYSQVIVAGSIDEVDGGPDGLVEVPHGADHPPVVIGMVGPVDVALLDQQEKTVPVPAKHLEGGQNCVF